jgi:hypothetical protein
MDFLIGKYIVIFVKDKVIRLANSFYYRPADINTALIGTVYPPNI